MVRFQIDGAAGTMAKLPNAVQENHRDRGAFNRGFVQKTAEKKHVGHATQVGAGAIQNKKKAHTPHTPESIALANVYIWHRRYRSGEGWDCRWFRR